MSIGVTCRFVYFKDSGKYYSEGEVLLPPKSGELFLPFHDAVDQCKTLLNSGVRPGLVHGMDFNALVTVFTPDGPLPVLMVRDKETGLIP